MTRYHNIIFLIIFVMIGLGITQELTLLKDNQQIPLNKVGEKIWVTEIDGELFYLIPKTEVDSLTKKIARQKAIIVRNEKVLASYDSLLNKYGKFENAARQHVQVQEKLIQTSDSLFRAYRELYLDVKKLAGMSNFAFIGGAGLNRIKSSEWKIVGSMGVEYRNWVGQFQFGKNFRGLIVGFRLPMGF